MDEFCAPAAALGDAAGRSVGGDVRSLLDPVRVLWCGLGLCAVSWQPPPAAAKVPEPVEFVVVDQEADRVTLQWRAVDWPSIREYHVLVGEVPHEHPDQPDWNGRSAAFCFTTDDGRPDNMMWASILDRLGCPMTVFTISGFIDAPGFLTRDELNALHASGHEIGGHSVNHSILTSDKAMRLRYVGAADSCRLVITGGALKTALSGDLPGLLIPLQSPPYRYLNHLAGLLDALPDYECVLDGYDFEADLTESRWLDLVPDPGVSIKDSPYQITTEKGSSDEELEYEVSECKRRLEEMIDDSSYVCETFAYPFHLHDQREMNAVMKAGYIAARDGYTGSRPTGSSSYPDIPGHVGLYEKSEQFTSWSNAASEEYTREAVRGYLQFIKNYHFWGHPRTAHIAAEIDSLHLTWMMEEVVADPDVWVASFGDIASYVRRFAINVSNPLVAGSDPLVCRVTLGGFDPSIEHYAVVVALDATGERSARSSEVAFGGGGGDPPGGGGGGVTQVGEPFGVGSPQGGHVSFAPNPTRGATRFRVRLETAAPGSLALYDVSGRRARVLRTGVFPAGESVVEWDGRDAQGRSASPGRYLYRFLSPGYQAKGKIELMR